MNDGGGCAVFLLACIVSFLSAFVTDIIDNVKKEKDAALIRFCHKFDGAIEYAKAAGYTDFEKYPPMRK